MTDDHRTPDDDRDDRDDRDPWWKGFDPRSPSTEAIVTVLLIGVILLLIGWNLSR